MTGWYAYFQHSKANTFVNVDGYVRRRLRRVLLKRQGKRGSGKGTAQQSWPNRWFAAQGLQTLEAAHEFTVTILQLSTH